jgi:N-methylhydantoinase A/oxoprolinase/acetone carboxylase beta subunit
VIRIGIDVGGTNTDAVLMDGAAAVAAHKTATTADVGGGVREALRRVLSGRHPDAPAIGAVMIGTTHFTNAVVERRRLLPTAAIRVAAPATTALPPLVAWPPDLRAAIGDHQYIVRGGRNYDGRPIATVDEAEVRSVAADIRRKGIRTVALNAVFSPLDPAVERQVGQLLRTEIPGLYVTLASDIGRLGLLERENAAVLNASLHEAAEHVVASLRGALDEAGVGAPLFISQNDGTLMSAERAARYPVLTFASGPTNSMRGAALLSGETEAVVVDIGGTTTDVGVLRNGFPREASAEVEIAGVRTNFRMPDVLSVGLGGGSVVRDDGGEVRVGPDSVGYELTARARVFGGDTLTATDIAVAAGHADLGDAALVQRLPTKLVARASDAIHRAVEDAIDRVKTSAGDMPVVLVGGGTILVDRPLAGASRATRPDHASVANAIGAAVAQVGGEVDRVVPLERQTRAEALEECRRLATKRAIAAGAVPASVAVVDEEDIPMTYIPGSKVSRFRVKAVGDLALEEVLP